MISGAGWQEATTERTSGALSEVNLPVELDLGARSRARLVKQAHSCREHRALERRPPQKFLPTNLPTANDSLRGAPRASPRKPLVRFFTDEYRGRSNALNCEASPKTICDRNLLRLLSQHPVRTAPRNRDVPSASYRIYPIAVRFCPC
jgi:hypothetical protein